LESERASLLVFTDLDGTLLDHHSYSWAPANQALARIAERDIPLILSSSKTCSEILQLRRHLHNRHPFIVENGSAVYVPAGYFKRGAGEPIGEFESRFFATERGKILEVLDSLRKSHGFSFRGFNDMTAEALAAATGLSREDARKANQRDCSEPIQWLDSDRALEVFREALASHGLNLLQGGRFQHVMGDTDKARGVAWLMQCYRNAWPDKDFVSIALGDSPNDRVMLETCDIPVVIKPARGEPLRLEDSNRVIYAEQPGPSGWQWAMDRLLEAYPG